MPERAAGSSHLREEIGRRRFLQHAPESAPTGKRAMRAMEVDFYRFHISAGEFAPPSVLHFVHVVGLLEGL